MSNTARIVVAVVGGGLLVGVAMPYVPIKPQDPTVAVALNVAMVAGATVLVYRLLGGAA